jgi:hypothetical protein
MHRTFGMALLACTFLILVTAPALAQTIVVVPAEEETEEEPEEATAVAEGMPTEIPPAASLPAGTVDGVRLTVRDETRPCLDPWHTPPAGRIWVCYMVTVYNETDETREYGPAQVVLIDDGGNVARPMLEMPLGDGLPAGNLPPGGAIAGRLRFEVTQSARVSALRFSPFPGRGGASLDIRLY